MPSNASVMFDGYPLLLNFVSISIRTGIAEERMKVSKQQREDIVVGQQANLVALSYLSIFTFTSAPQVSNHAQQALLIFLLLRQLLRPHCCREKKHAHPRDNSHYDENISLLLRNIKVIP